MKNQTAKALGISPWIESNFTLSLFSDETMPQPGVIDLTADDASDPAREIIEWDKIVAYRPGWWNRCLLAEKFCADAAQLGSGGETTAAAGAKQSRLEN